MTTREIKIVIGTFAVIVFATLTAFIKTVSDDKYADIIQAVSSIFSLIISLIAIYYVFKTYNAQKEENVESKKELERNRQDTEFNRSLDTVYKQLEYSKYTIEHLNPQINKTIGDIKIEKGFQHNAEILVKDRSTLSDVLKIVADEVLIYQKMIDQNKVGYDNSLMLIDIITRNLGNGVILKVYKLQEVLNVVNDDTNPKHVIMMNWIKSELDRENEIRSDLVDNNGEDVPPITRRLLNRSINQISAQCDMIRVNLTP